jgi:hypothetical protein
VPYTEVSDGHVDLVGRQIIRTGSVAVMSKLKFEESCTVWLALVLALEGMKARLEDADDATARVFLPSCSHSQRHSVTSPLA